MLNIHLGQCHITQWDLTGRGPIQHMAQAACCPEGSKQLNPSGLLVSLATGSVEPGKVHCCLTIIISQDGYIHSFNKY